jgi:hypothetical protein
MILLVISASNIMIHDRRKKEEEVKKKKKDFRKLMWGFGYCAANQNYQPLLGFAV